MKAMVQTRCHRQADNLHAAFAADVLPLRRLLLLLLPPMVFLLSLLLLLHNC
jgi:hypothetical protein